jgi:hypothetical protein
MSVSAGQSIVETCSQCQDREVGISICIPSLVQTMFVREVNSVYRNWKKFAEVLPGRREMSVVPKTTVLNKQ